MTSICCSAASSDTYLVMGDVDKAVTVGEVTRDVENVASEGLARCAEIPSLKSVQADVVYDSISSLKVYAINWKIQGRCTRKSKITPFQSGKGKPGTMMTFDFQDGSGKKIKGVVFNDAIEMLDQKVFVGKNYAISKATVQNRFGRPVAGYHNCELLFYKHSQLEDEDDFVVPVERYRRLCELDSGDVEIDSSINVLGVVSSVGTMQNMEIKNSDGTIRDAAYLEVQLVNSSFKQGQVPVTFWGPTAADVRRHPAGRAMKLKGAVVVSREGRLCLKATGLTDVEFDPQTDAAQDLIRWFDGSKKRRVCE
ncbi:hypothetical protein OUZ56_032288 [Daphnia magna]|uniref:Replication protein A 70 kDa DNA-binding subunit n=1 Tax=Daphnia magna TaxID=35525 RepID=A0ABQ9ZWS6_9CRUS|nr:hypothetical protein OUZ56_032288 [Daphnia magna]